MKCYCWREFLRWWIITAWICMENMKNIWSNDMSDKLIKSTGKNKELSSIFKQQRWFERYQSNIVEPDKSLTEEGDFNYILNW